MEYFWDSLLMSTVVLHTRCILRPGLTRRPDCLHIVVCAGALVHSTL